MSHLQQGTVAPLPTFWLRLDRNTGHGLLGEALILRGYAVKCHVCVWSAVPTPLER